MDKELFKRIIDLLASNPEMATVEDRRAFVTRALYGSPVLKNIVWDGDAYKFTTMLVYRLYDHSDETLLLLLEEVKVSYGVNWHSIDEIIQKIRDPDYAGTNNSKEDPVPIPPPPVNAAPLDLKRALIAVCIFGLSLLVIQALLGRPQTAYDPPKLLTPAALANGEKIALTPVVENTAWTPIEREFNKVLMVLVPKGCFMMGSKEGDTDEVPLSQQCFEEPFWIDKYEVTNLQFANFNGKLMTKSEYEKANRPHAGVTWYEAQQFCARRDARLPTEREWEYAARGPNAWFYPWGEMWNPDNAAWDANSNDDAVDVGHYKDGQSWVGAHDMAGNALEWVNTIYKAYPYDGRDGREENTVIDDKVQRVVRGSSWDFFKDVNLRASIRFKFMPTTWDPYFGFRCVHP
jgi:formylglycine-generating enzyme required for sulfatase activity